MAFKSGMNYKGKPIDWKQADFYLKSTKFGGALFVILGIAMIILPLILE